MNFQSSSFVVQNNVHILKPKPTIKYLIWATLTITLHYQHLKFYAVLISLLKCSCEYNCKNQNPQLNVTCRDIKDEAKP